jgi:alanyl-tRNA synthetase
MVSSDRLRFDISHPKQVTPEEIARVEAIVNKQVRTNTDVTTRLMEPEQAVEAGAMALFGEKYGDEVRVLSMGADEGKTFSTELCGGTHVRRTGDIGYFKVVSESAVGAGLRRIEALTGPAAEAYTAAEEKALLQAASVLKVAPNEVATRVADLVEERRKLERDVAELRRKLATGGGGNGAEVEVKEIGGVKFSPRVVEDVSPKDLKTLADDLKKKIGSGVVAVISTAEGKASLVVGVTDDLTGKFSAVDLVRAGSAALGGKGGGGRPDMAQAGGPDAAKADAAIAAIEAALG